ncbi:probable cytochrome P450 6a14 [Aethina tumida]|uniref:probable cytochrome P450 6a14 n=1 Tax=Aethina tumida TaxID=116153 RepID=UPI0021487770|nr:probable cytochrome P450 6a14 [Aethina tumida]
MTPYLVAAIVVLLVLIVTFFKYKFTYWEKRGVNYFTPSIPLGNMNTLFKKNRESIGEFIKNSYMKARNNNWKHFGMYLFTNPAYMAIDLDIVKLILSKDFQYFVDRGLFYNEKIDPLGAHLFAIGGTKWRNLRRKLTPTFTSGKMRQMFSTVAKCGLILDKVMQKELEANHSLNIKEVLARFTTDVIGTCAFGLECNTFEDKDSPFRYYGRKILNLGTKMQQLALSIAMSFPRLGVALGVRQIDKDVSDFFFNVVKDTVEYREKNNVVRKDFLQLLMEMKSDDKSDGDGNTLTITEIAAQCLLFFLAGFETSSTAMTFALFELSQNQELQDKAREEVVRVLAKHKGEITYESISEMHYMDQVLDESLRKYPPLPMVTRICGKDYKIPNEDVVIEKGTRVVIPIYGIHHDPEYYDEPEKFDPERFSPENKAERNPYSHIPFGEGNRICIGLRFGVMQSKIGLAVLLKSYRFKLSDKTKVPLVFEPSSFALTAEGGIWLDCTRI